jgi:hypothetical protein
VRQDDANLAAVRKGFELFNAGRLDAVFTEVFHPEIDYRGDPDISALAGFAPDAKGADAVRAVWEAFFAMFEQAQLSEIELEATGDDEVLGDFHMVAHGGESEVPIDAPFYFAGVLRDGLWRFLAVKLDRDAVLASLEAWRIEQSRAGADGPRR